MCDELKTHTDGRRGLCKGHAYLVKQVGDPVALELEPEPTGKTCEWVDLPEQLQESEQLTEE